MKTKNLILCCLCLLLPVGAHAFTIIDGEVTEFSGPDDLFLDPATNVIAVNPAGIGDLVVNGVTFQADGIADLATGIVTNGAVTVVTSRVGNPGGGAINDWATPSGGGVTPAYVGADPTSTDNLEIVMQSIRWAQGAVAGPAPNGRGLDIEISGLNSDSLYDIQLLFNEGRATATDPDGGRRWDIGVEGEMVVDDFSSRGGDGNWTSSNGFTYRGKFEPGADGTLTIRMQADLGGEAFSGTDGNPIISGIVVHESTPVAPDDILLSDSTIPATAPPGTRVGILSSSDTNGGSHTYSLVAGAGDAGNASFQISGDELRTAADLSALGGSTLSVRVRSTDQTNLFFEKLLEIKIDEDSDSDLLPDPWELGFRPDLSDLTGLKPGPGPGPDSGDFDGDGSTDLDEFANDTDPDDEDSDDDGSNDGDEAANMTDPNDPDSDDDGLNDGDEAANMTDPHKRDTDGDNLGDNDELIAGTDPTLADTDGDGRNDDTDPAPLDPNIFSQTVALSGDIIEFKGPDDLNLDPSTVVVAVDVFGDGDKLINGVNFQGDGSITGTGTVTNGDVSVTTTAVNGIPDWAAIQSFTGADAISASNLALVMQSIRWQPAPDPVTVDISGLSPGALYEVQLLVNENGDRARVWDIGVEGELVVDGFTSEGYEGINVWAPDNSFAYVGEFEGPPDGILNVVMQADIGGSPPGGTDNNPILQGIIVHLAAPSSPFVITEITRDPGSGISTITWNSSPGRSYAVDFSPDMQGGELDFRWEEIDDGIPSQGEQTSFNDPIPRLGPRGFYRVRVP